MLMFDKFKTYWFDGNDTRHTHTLPYIHRITVRVDWGGWFGVGGRGGGAAKSSDGVICCDGVVLVGRLSIRSYQRVASTWVGAADTSTRGSRTHNTLQFNWHIGLDGGALLSHSAIRSRPSHQKFKVRSTQIETSKYRRRRYTYTARHIHAKKKPGNHNQMWYRLWIRILFRISTPNTIFYIRCLCCTPHTR